jgi:hypothetical protein
VGVRRDRVPYRPRRDLGGAEHAIRMSDILVFAIGAAIGVIIGVVFF